MSKVPKKLHAIWLGGILEQPCKKNIEDWKNKNPDYEMNVWIDSSTYLTSNSEESRQQKDQYIQFKNWAKTNKIIINDINPNSQDSDPNLVKRPAIFKGMPNKKYYLDELRDPGSNYAAASDILRVELLYQEGGVYFDAKDVYPAQPLGSLEVSEEEGILVRGWGNSSIRSVNNDLMASIPAGNTISAYRQAIKEKYAELYSKDEAYLSAHRFQQLSSFRTKRHDRRLSTMKLSGPTLLKTILRELRTRTLFPEQMWATPQRQSASWYDKDINTLDKFSQNLRLNIIEYFNLIIENNKNLEKTNQSLLSGFKQAINCEKKSIPMTQLLKKVKTLFNDADLKQLNDINDNLFENFEIYCEETERFLLYCRFDKVEVRVLWDFFNKKADDYDDSISFQRNIANKDNILYFFKNQFLSGFFKTNSIINPFPFFYSKDAQQELSAQVEIEMNKLDAAGLVESEPFIESPLKNEEKRLADIKLALSTAQNNYQLWYQEENNLRGPDGHFSRFFFRHGSIGQWRALSLKNEISNSEDLDSAISKVNEFLESSWTRYNRHSFASFLLDELNKISKTPWNGINPTQESNLYDSEEVINHLSLTL
jgi:mannosyltransferase OCH1-like enzyme